VSHAASFGRLKGLETCDHSTTANCSADSKSLISGQSLNAAAWI
jgi:hypothetical protein